MSSSDRLSIPPSSSTVRLSAINTLLMGNISISTILEPEVGGVKNLDNFPSWCYVIEHTDSDGIVDRVIFDLGLRKDYQNSPPSVLGLLKVLNWSIDIDKDVTEVLQEQGMGLASFSAIIWSHYHFDHTGNPALFPPSTKLIVGPGFKETFLPGFPEAQDSPLNADAWADRELYEIDFAKESSGLNIGGFEAWDYFGDGSFYILNCPGHCIGHICGLARTTSDTFVFLGGDTSHHPGVFRPSSHVPLPQQIAPNPLSDDPSSSCSCSIFERIHPHGKRDVPFYTIPPSVDGQPGPNYNSELTLQNRDKMTVFDGAENVFVIIAHDASVTGIIETFPKTLNEWHERGWKAKSRWRFLKDFRSAVSNTLEEKAKV